MPDAIRRVLIIGATGLVGRELVRLTAERPEVEEVVALVRRDPGARPSTKVSYRVVDFDQLVGLEDAFRVDAMLCALGTIAATTRDPIAYRHIEVEIPLTVAARARAAGARRLGLVSTLGADENARAVYLRQKGELEELVGALGWERLVIARPSVLAGRRDESRWNERLGGALARLLPLRYRTISGRQVAEQLVKGVFRDGPATEVLTNTALHAS